MAAKTLAAMMTARTTLAKTTAATTAVMTLAVMTANKPIFPTYAKGIGARPDAIFLCTL
jgi:hypothetical protein